MIPGSKRPSSMATAARRWLSRAYSSTSPRPNPSIVAIRSAEMPWGTVGTRSRKAGLSPSIVTEPTARFHRDIDSTPPATTRSWWPLPTPIAATEIACCAEPQNRFSVRPGTVSGQPARSVPRRPTASWSPVRIPLPAMTSSTSTGSNPTREASALRHWANSSCGCTACSAPSGRPRPRGVRTTSTIHASPNVRSLPERSSVGGLRRAARG